MGDGLYSGNRYAAAGAGAVPLARNVAAEGISIGMQQVARNVDGVVAGLQKFADDSTKLDDALELRRISAEAARAMEERENLPDGDANALFNADGSPNKAAVSELLRPFAVRLDKVGRKLADPDERAQMRYNAQAAWVDLEDRAYRMAERASRARRDRKLGDGYNLAMETGDYEGAALYAKAGSAAGSWTPEKGELMAYEAGQAGMMRQVSQAFMAPGHEGFLALYDDPGFRAGLSAGNLQKLESLADKLTTEPRETVRHTRAADGSVKAERVVEPPYGLPGYALAFWRKYNGGFKDNAQARQEAIHVVHQLARGIITTADDPAEVELLKQRADLFGVSREYAGAVAKRLQKELAGDADYKPEQAVDGLGEFAFLTPQNAEMVRGWRRELMQLQDSEDGDSGRIDKLKRDIKRWEGYAKDEASKAKRVIAGKFDAWCMARPDAGYQEKVERYWDFVQEYRVQEKKNMEDVRDSAVFRHERDAAGVYTHALADRRMQAGDEHAAYLEDVQATNARVQQERAADGAAGGFDGKMEAAGLLDGGGALAVSTDPCAARSFAGNETEGILYVPASSGLTDGQRIVVSTPGDVAAEATVRVQEGIGCAVMSQKLRCTLGCVRPVYNSLDFVGGEARLGVGGGVRPGHGLDAAGLIFRSEARFDKDGRLAVYAPPSGDGGGAYEVAGINAASHPQEAARLRAMVQAGQYAAAEREAKRYIMEYTQPVADFLGGAGVKSKGVDYYMRDVFMNGGAAGAAKVLNRAVGAGGAELTDETREKLREFMRTHSAKDLLLKLRDVRMQWYSGIGKANPGKRKFLPGWTNRTREAYKSALAFA